MPPQPSHRERNAVSHRTTGKVDSADACEPLRTGSSAVADEARKEGGKYGSRGEVSTWPEVRAHVQQGLEEGAGREEELSLGSDVRRGGDVDHAWEA